jgi:hypothetical protein
MDATSAKLAAFFHLGLMKRQAGATGACAATPKFALRPRVLARRQLTN